MELVLGWYTGIHPRVSSHKRNITHNDSFPYRYNYKRAVYFLHINLGREISFYLSLFLSRYTINDWSMANGLLFRFKLQSLPIAPCISRIYTVRSWWASRINHPTWVHRANMNFLSKRIVRRVLLNIAKSKLHNLYNVDKFITIYIIYYIIHNSIGKLILHAIDTSGLTRIVAFSIFRINISNHLRVSLASKFELEFLSISRFISVV